MKRILFPILVLSLLQACQQQGLQKINFVSKGIPQQLELRGFETEDGGYLQAEEEYYLRSEMAVFGDHISVRLKMSLDNTKGHTVIVIGDNAFGISSWIAEDLDMEEDDKAIFLRGPSIDGAQFLGTLSELLEPDVPFELVMKYANGSLSYSIDGEEIYVGETTIPPAGMIQIEEWRGNLRIYDLVCEGQFKAPDAFYTKEFLLQRAEKSVAAAAERVKGDPNRPAYHFQPPANWNNDPNGMLFHDGYYHMFYQHNPYGDRWDWMHWGHARSPDLVHWEHLPIALWPSLERGERHCFSGSGYIMDNGDPILFYTSIGHENPEHWAATPLDKELMDWQKHPRNPLIVMEDHDGEHIEDWRDPFLFREAGETYMVIGGHPEDQGGSIMMYKALNPELTEWDYLGTPYTGEEGNWECPNFFKVEDKYVLIYSPHGRVEYYVGEMDFEAFEFKPIRHGNIDNGLNYYAPNTLQKGEQRRLLFGWIPDFKEDQGWQSAITVPRDLSLDDENYLVQVPVDELVKLRGEHQAFAALPAKPHIDMFQAEILIDLAGEGVDHLGFSFNDEDGDPYVVELTNRSFHFNDEEVEIVGVQLDRIEKLQIFLDRTVVEFFVNDGAQVATFVVYPDRENLDFQVFSKDKHAKLAAFDVWQLKSIW